MQSAYTVLILLMLVGVSRLIGRLIPLPLPLVQIGAGALLAWPSLGLHVALDPELFLFLFLPPLLFSDGWRMPKRELWRLRGPILTLAVGLEGIVAEQVVPVLLSLWRCGGNRHHGTELATVCGSWGDHHHLADFQHFRRNKASREVAKKNIALLGMVIKRHSLSS